MVGSTQLPLSFGLKMNLGASTASAVVSSYLLLPYEGSPYLNVFRQHWGRVWQLMFLVAAMIGGALACIPDGFAPLAVREFTSEAEAFIGGFVLLVGARLASGCASGHGITGVGHQCIISLLSVGAMFAGGMATHAIFYS
jgi:uncharacterized protein